MVLITPTEEEQCDQQLVITCGNSSLDMAQPGEMDNATTSPVASASPSPATSPSSAIKSSLNPEDTYGVQNDSKKSPSSNGCTLANKSDPLRENPALSLIHTMRVKQEKKEEEETPQFAMQVKQEEELDAPLDFSIKRRDSPSESSTLKPQHYHLFSSPSPSQSPDSNQHQAALHDHQHEHASDCQGQGQEHASSAEAKPTGGSSKLGGKASSGSPTAVNSPLTTLGIISDGSGVGVTPASLTAVLGQNGSIAAPLSGVPSLLEEARKLQAVSSGKVQRPFKAYPKEVLRMPLGYLGLPGVSPFPSMDPGYVQGLAVRPEELMTVYKQQSELLKEREKQAKNTSKRSSRSPPSSSLSPSPGALSANGKVSATHTSPPPSSTPASPPQPSQSSILGTHTDSPSPGASVGSHTSSTSQPPANFLSVPDVNPDTNSTLSTLPVSSTPSQVSSTSSVTTAGNNRKRPRNFPDSEKDDAYWERRRKNNDAAKRSRDARRAKEDEIALRAALLEQENLRLRVEVATLKTETARLRCLLYKT